MQGRWEGGVRSVGVEGRWVIGSCFAWVDAEVSVAAGADGAFLCLENAITGSDSTRLCITADRPLLVPKSTVMNLWNRQ